MGLRTNSKASSKPAHLHSPIRRFAVCLDKQQALVKIQANKASGDTAQIYAQAHLQLNCLSEGPFSHDAAHYAIKIVTSSLWREYRALPLLLIGTSLPLLWLTVFNVLSVLRNVDQHQWTFDVRIRVNERKAFLWPGRAIYPIDWLKLVYPVNSSNYFTSFWRRLTNQITGFLNDIQ